MSNEPTLPKRETYAPNDIAEAVFGREGAFQGGKRVRAYLRANYARKPESKGKTWTLTPNVAESVFEHFISERTSEVTDANDAK